MAKSKSNEIKLSRVYDATVKQVWDAWVDPEQCAQWWGPRGFTLTNDHKDVRTGGSWKYTMHGPDGTDWPNVTQFLEVEKYRRMVYDHGGSEDKPPLFRVTATFEEKKGKTHLELSFALATPEAAEETRKFIKKANGESTWDRLAEFLAKENGQEKFVINRSFDAPIETLYQMWTDPHHFSKWLAPTGFTMEFKRADLRPGGSTFYYMDGPGGMRMYGRAEYKEFHRPDRISYTQQFCDENEKVTRHPMAPTWPETMLTTVQLTAEGDDRTRVTVTWEPYGKWTREEMDTFVKQKSGMNMGWSGSFDKLESYLSER
ncbi:MAG TPA: SRPBCC family protein [Bdellovibrionota bacterium]|jgi:uncharacterized protein YndB with AHSA1/START domain|nr:SRPBCC family protein [Bdellovibrionota bacterium]